MNFLNLLILCYLYLFQTISCEYEANWDSLDSRPLPDWYDKSKIGILVYWGVYSVPSYEQSAWLWWWWQGKPVDNYVNFMKQNYKPDFTYQDFAPEFRAEFFDPDQWASLFRQSGAKYVVLTSKHHDGYHLWPTKYAFGWNSMDVGPKRDLVGDLAKAVRSQGLKFGVYHSLYEWFNPSYLKDKANNWESSVFVDSKIIPEMKELVETYHPEVLWSDGDWEAPPEYWKSQEFLAWLYNESPVKDTIVTNDRWGIGTICKHGGFLSCADRFSPGYLLSQKWESITTIDAIGWGYRRTLPYDWILSPEILIGSVAETISCGGNILINVGPTKEGTIIPIFQERLLELGEWLGINGEAIYESTPWTTQNDTMTSDVWYTSKENVVYALVLFWPEGDILDLESVVPLFKNKKPLVTMLGNDDLPLAATSDGATVSIHFPDKAKVRTKWVYTLKIAINSMG